MSVIKDRHKAYRDANLVFFKKRHRGSRFAGTARRNTKSGYPPTQ